MSRKLFFVWDFPPFQRSASYLFYTDFTLILYYFQVCGLKWSLDGRYLASGGNDNMLYIWPVVTGRSHSQPQPLYTFR